MNYRYFIIIMLLLAYTANAAELLQIESKTNPASIVPGSAGYIELKLANIGSTGIERIELSSANFATEIKQKTPVYLEDLGSLDAGKTLSIIKEFSVASNAAPGFYTATFNIRACQSNLCKSYVHYGVITVQSPANIELSSVEPTELKPGENETIFFTLNNFADNALSNVAISWEDPSRTILPYGMDNRKTVSEIKAKSQAKIPMAVIVIPDAKSNIYPLAVKISYTDNVGSQHTSNSTVGISIKGDMSFIVTLESSNEKEISVKIANSGTQDAQFLTVKASADFPLNPQTVYVGELKSDDYDTEKFFVSPGEGKNEIKLLLEYKDVYGKTYSEEKMIEFLVQKAVSNQPSYTYAIVIVFALILAYIFYKKRKKPK
ncbi:MAG TPA: hypothetical protein VJB11_03150 [archaeon]|nr:hypothetical protein [archaeon]